MPLPADVVEALRESRLSDPFSVLGLHPENGVLHVRAWLRGATAVSVVRRGDGARFALGRRHADGLFEGAIPGATERFAYDLAVREGDAPERLLPDTYAFWPQLSEFDLGLFRSGHHCHLGDLLGAQALTIDGVDGVRFAVWAPTAERVSVVGDWNGFDGRWHPMRPRGWKL